LGHSQISITADTYSHVAARTPRETAVQMDELLNVAIPTVEGVKSVVKTGVWDDPDY
jgi:hypothetical protein